MVKNFKIFAAKNEVTVSGFGMEATYKRYPMKIVPLKFSFLL